MTSIPPENLDLARAIERFCGYLAAERNYSPHTVAAYRRDLLDMGEHFCRLEELEDMSQARPGDINEGHLRAYMRYSLEERGLSKASLNRRLASLRAFFKYALLWHMAEDDPTADIKQVKKDKLLPRYLTYTEMESLICSPTEDTLTGRRDRAILILLCCCGLRIGEAAALNIGAIDWSRGYIRVLGKGSRERMQPADADTLSALRSYLQLRQEEGQPADMSDPLFLNARGRPMSGGSFRYLVNKYVDQAALMKRISPHSLRHTFATRLMDNGADIRTVQELLGHKAIAATQIYTHVSINRLKAVYQQSHPRSGHKKEE